MVGRFWTPVGQGPKPQKETDYVIATLFKGINGVQIFDKNVGQRMESLPGFAGFKVVTNRIAAISIQGYCKPRIITI